MILNNKLAEGGKMVKGKASVDCKANMNNEIKARTVQTLGTK